MIRPTKQEYEIAINGNKYLKDLIERNKKELDKNLDVIIQLKNYIKEFEKSIEHNNKIIMLYNLYAESENIFKEGEVNENSRNG